MKYAKDSNKELEKEQKTQGNNTCGATVSTSICDLCIQWVRSLNYVKIQSRNVQFRTACSHSAPLYFHKRVKVGEGKAVCKDSRCQCQGCLYCTCVDTTASTFRDSVICCGHCTMYIDLQQNCCCGCFWGISLKETQTPEFARVWGSSRFFVNFQPLREPFDSPHSFAICWDCWMFV